MFKPNTIYYMFNSSIIFMDIGDVCDVLKPIGTKLWKCGVSLLSFVLKLICSLRKLGLF